MIYRSSSQSSEELHIFLTIWNCYLIIPQIKTRLYTWLLATLIQGQKKLKVEGKKFEFLTSKCGFKQVISDQTHILASSSSCIYFIFTPQPNIVMNSGVHSSLHPNCYHQITHVKFNLKTLYHLHMKESFGNIKMQIMI